jgi:hypothetical protein
VNIEIFSDLFYLWMSLCWHERYWRTVSFYDRIQINMIVSFFAVECCCFVGLG